MLISVNPSIEYFGQFNFYDKTFICIHGMPPLLYRGFTFFFTYPEINAIEVFVFADFNPESV